MAALLGQLQARADEMAVTITQEMGSPISFSHMAQVMATKRQNQPRPRPSAPFHRFHATQK